MYKKAGNKVRPVIHLRIQQPKGGGVDCHRTKQKGGKANGGKLSEEREAQLISLIKEAKKKSKGGAKDFEESLSEVLKKGNPLVKPSERLSETVKELRAKSDK